MVMCSFVWRTMSYVETPFVPLEATLSLFSLFETTEKDSLDLKKNTDFNKWPSPHLCNSIISVPRAKLSKFFLIKEHDREWQYNKTGHTLRWWKDHLVSTVEIESHYVNIWDNREHMNWDRRKLVPRTKYNKKFIDLVNW